jgi:hypothetical protein
MLEALAATSSALVSTCPETAAAVAPNLLISRGFSNK